MNGKLAKRLRKAAAVLAQPKPWEPIVKGTKDVVVGFNEDGTEKKLKMFCVTMMYPADSRRTVYKNLKNKYKGRELLRHSVV